MTQVHECGCGCCENHGADHVYDHTELDHDTDQNPPIVDQAGTRIPAPAEEVEVEVVGGTIDPAEQDAYLAYAKRQNGSKLKKLVIHIDGEEVDLEYHLRQDGFQRIRRITGGPTV